MSDRQEFIDRFYFQHGPCCAGCDWWRSINSVVGECWRSAPVKEVERVAMLGLESSSQHVGAGHVYTKRGHHCGDFKDDFDWSSLPIGYRLRVGDPSARQTPPSV